MRGQIKARQVANPAQRGSRSTAEPAPSQDGGDAALRRDRRAGAFAAPKQLPKQALNFSRLQARSPHFSGTPVVPGIDGGSTLWCKGGRVARPPPVNPGGTIGFPVGRLLNRCTRTRAEQLQPQVGERAAQRPCLSLKPPPGVHRPRGMATMRPGRYLVA